MHTSPWTFTVIMSRKGGAGWYFIKGGLNEKGWSQHDSQVLVNYHVSAVVLVLDKYRTDSYELRYATLKKCCFSFSKF